MTSPSDRPGHLRPVPAPTQLVGSEATARELSDGESGGVA